jgi:hypothetical protein
MMGLDTPETCWGWRNILRISCASSWFFFTRIYRDAGQQNVKFTSNFAVLYKKFCFGLNFVDFLPVCNISEGGGDAPGTTFPITKFCESLTSSERAPWRGIQTRGHSCCTSKTWNSSTHRRIWPTSNSVFLECGWLFGGGEVNIPYRIPPHFDVTYHK